MDSELYFRYSDSIGGIIRHVNRVIEMIEADDNCADVLIELSKARSALDDVGVEMLQAHVTSSFDDMLEQRKPVKLEDLQYLINTFVK